MIRQELTAKGGAEPFAFLASRMDRSRVPLYDLRREIYELGVRLGRPIWVAEHSQPGLDRSPAAEVQATCLRYARAADEFIAIIDGSYGAPWNLTDFCVLELEVLTAALSGQSNSGESRDDVLAVRRRKS